MFPHQVQSSIIIWSPPRGEVVIFLVVGNHDNIVFLVWNSFRATQKHSFSLFLLVGLVKAQTALKETSSLLSEEKELFVVELYVHLHLSVAREPAFHAQQEHRSRRERQSSLLLQSSVTTSLGVRVVVLNRSHRLHV